MLYEELNQGFHRLELWPLGKTGAQVEIKMLRCRSKSVVFKSVGILSTYNDT